MRTPLVLFGIAVLGIPVLGIPVLGIARADEPSLADKETARTLFFEGDEKFRAGDYEGALEAFRAADAIMKVPTTGLEVGRTLMKLDRLLEAVETLQRVTSIPEAEDENEIQTKARAEASILLEKVRAEVPGILVVVEGAGDIAPVLRVDGADIPISAHGFPRKVDPGEHVIEVSATGFQPQSRRIAVSAGQQERVVFVLEPLAPAAEPTSPRAPAEPGFDLERVPVWAWVGYGVGAAGLVAGAITGGVTVANVDDLERSCEGSVCPPGEQDRLEEARSIAHASTACFVIGGAGIAVGIAGTVLGLTGDDEQAIVPLLGPGFVGARGRF